MILAIFSVPTPKISADFITLQKIQRSNLLHLGHICVFLPPPRPFVRTKLLGAMSSNLAHGMKETKRKTVGTYQTNGEGGGHWPYHPHSLFKPPRGRRWMNLYPTLSPNPNFCRFDQTQMLRKNGLCVSIHSPRGISSLYANSKVILCHFIQSNLPNIVGQNGQFL